MIVEEAIEGSAIPNISHDKLCTLRHSGPLAATQVIVNYDSVSFFD
jgi:hypothetical protein